MNRNLILSKLRVELRRKQSDYLTEKLTLNWITQFMDELAISHSSQIRLWQKEYFISKLNSGNHYSKNEILQARSSLLFLFDKVLGKGVGIELNPTQDEYEAAPEIFRVTG
jgi:hypothetical protein